MLNEYCATRMGLILQVLLRNKADAYSPKALCFYLRSALARSCC